MTDPSLDAGRDTVVDGDHEAQQRNRDPHAKSAPQDYLTNLVGGGLSGSVMGALSGAESGPIGAAAGAVLGGTVGLVAGLVGTAASQDNSSDEKDQDRPQAHAAPIQRTQAHVGKIAAGGFSGAATGALSGAAGGPAGVAAGAVLGGAIGMVAGIIGSGVQQAQLNQQPGRRGCRCVYGGSFRRGRRPRGHRGGRRSWRGQRHGRWNDRIGRFKRGSRIDARKRRDKFE